MTWELVVKRHISWSDLEDQQTELIRKVQSNPQLAFLLISEPKPTFTFGRNSNPNELLWSSETLKEKGVQVFPVSRGGKWTYHGPGQILIYPILHLPSHGYSSKSVRQFLEDLRQSVQDSLETLGCQKISKQEPFGLYIANKKLASFGLAFQRGISSHGLALYYQDQSLFFSGITPCGVPEGKNTFLLDHLSSTPSWDSVAKTVSKEIKNRFSLRASQVL
jgi:lipoyl(octanoyl) transferase